MIEQYPYTLIDIWIQNNFIILFICLVKHKCITVSSAKLIFFPGILAI